MRHIPLKTPRRGRGVNKLTMHSELKAPFPWFGGKSTVASEVWRRLGDVDNYIEPFAGSLAILWKRPHAPRTETVTDLDCYISNFWRSIKHAPDAVAEHADWPVLEADLHARHRWLVLGPQSADFRQRMRTDPEYFEPKFAGWWCWGLCCWIGSGFCTDPDGQVVHGPHGGSGEKRPAISGNGGGEINIGVLRKLPEKYLKPQRPQLSKPGHCGDGIMTKLPDSNRPQLADAYSVGRGVNAGNPAGDRAGICQTRRQWLMTWFAALADRLRLVRVLCGDWKRTCNSPSVTTRLGSTGVFLDPPYGAKAGRNPGLYAVDSLTVADECRAWCLERGGDKQMRIALCGYAGEHEELEKNGWTVFEWKTQGGYGNKAGQPNENAAKERMWFSPHCLREKTLFDGAE